MTNDAKLDELFRLNGIDITREKGIADQFKADLEAANAKVEKWKDYDTILTERNDLKNEKTEREFTDRFVAALGENKPKNDFTKQGLRDMFKAATLDEANKGKKDDELFAAIIKDHETEYFEGKVNITLPNVPPQPNNPSGDQAYLDAKYANNPFYKK